MELIEENKKLTEALNYEGKFFEKIVIDKISSIPTWEIAKVEYPFAIYSNFSPRADFIAKRSANHLIYLIGEAKKAHPNFKQWVFFPFHSLVPKDYPDEFILEEHLEINSDNKDVNRKLQHMMHWNLCSKEEPLFFCNDAREIRITRDKTSTKKPVDNERIETGALQVSLCTNGLINEEERYFQHIVNIGHKLKWYVRFVPILITNANLLVCEFDTKKHNESYDIGIDGAKYKQAKWLVYKYPINEQELLPKPDRVLDLGFRDFIKYKNIYVVNINFIESFLSAITRIDIIKKPEFSWKNLIK